MADNTARARQELSGQRRAIADHVEKWRRYTEDYEKRNALKTVERAQSEIRKLKSGHPSLRGERSWQDEWTTRQG